MPLTLRTHVSVKPKGLTKKDHRSPETHKLVLEQNSSDTKPVFQKSSNTNQ